MCADQTVEIRFTQFRYRCGGKCMARGKVKSTRRGWAGPLSSVADGIKRAKARKLLTTPRDLWFLRRFGLFRSLREATQSSEPDFREFAQLVDPNSLRLVVTVENWTEAEVSTKVIRGVFESIGLHTRVEIGQLSLAELREAWIADGRGWSRPRRPATVHDIAVSFDDAVLTFWADEPLSTRDFPMNPHPVVSALLLGRPLPEILHYYRRWGSPLPRELVSTEVHAYLGFVREWGKTA